MKTFWHGRRVFITGATGLLGPWLVKDLIEQQAHVYVLIRDLVHDSLFFQEELDKKVTVVHGDLLDYQLLLRVLNECDIETVFHLGAQAIVGYANRSPLSTFKSNIEGTWNLLEACRLSPWVKRIIVASSDKAYGAQQQLPYKETTPLEGRHPYDVSKSCTDLIAQSYFHTYKLPICITRCGNFFGGGDLHTNRIIPGTIASLLQEKRPIIRSDGLFVRDYIYVKDVVNAYLTLAEHMDSETIIGESFNFSTDKPFTVINIVQKIQTLMNALHLEPLIKNESSNEILAQHLCSEKAKKLLKWQPAYGVTKGLKETIAWYQNCFKNKKNLPLNITSAINNPQSFVDIE